MKRKTKKHNYYHLVAIILSVVFITGLMFVHENTARAAANSAVYFNPASATANVNGTFSLDAMINPGTNQVSIVELHIVFDRTKVRLDSMTPNTSTSVGDFSGVMQAVQIDNNTGTASVILDTGSGTNYVTTVKKIATLSFTAIASGATSITMAGTQAAAKNEGSTNVIATLTPATVTVGTATPTYTITDFGHIVANWLKTNATFVLADGDINGDKTVNTRDLGIVMHFWK
jgi:hypothetical protein